jgi:hypothetical protein
VSFSLSLVHWLSASVGHPRGPRPFRSPWEVGRQRHERYTHTRRLVSLAQTTLTPRSLCAISLSLSVCRARAPRVPRCAAGL